MQTAFRLLRRFPFERHMRSSFRVLATLRRPEPPPSLSSLAERSQEVTKGPVGHVCTLPPGDIVCEAEVDSLIDASVDHIVCEIRETSCTHEAPSSWRW